MGELFKAGDSYWNGRTWVYQADITNGGGGAGNHSYTVTVASGNELEVLYGELFNGDTSNRTGEVIIDDGTNQLSRFLSGTINAAARWPFPIADGQAAAGMSLGGGRVIISGTMRLVATVASVAASENTAFAVVCRIRGGIPTVVEVGASTPTININTETIF